MFSASNSIQEVRQEHGGKCCEQIARIVYASCQYVTFTPLPPHTHGSHMTTLLQQMHHFTIHKMKLG